MLQTWHLLIIQGLSDYLLRFGHECSGWTVCLGNLEESMLCWGRSRYLLGEMSTFGSETFLISDEVDGVLLAISTNPGDGSTDNEGFILSTSVLQFSLFRARNTITGLITVIKSSKVTLCLWRKSPFKSLITNIHLPILGYMDTLILPKFIELI